MANHPIGFLYFLKELINLKTSLTFLDKDIILLSYKESWTKHITEILYTDYITTTSPGNKNKQLFRNIQNQRTHYIIKQNEIPELCTTPFRVVKISTKDSKFENKDQEKKIKDWISIRREFIDAKLLELNDQVIYIDPLFRRKVDLYCKRKNDLKLAKKRHQNQVEEEKTMENDMDQYIKTGEELAEEMFRHYCPENNNKPPQRTHTQEQKINSTVFTPTGNSLEQEHT